MNATTGEGFRFSANTERILTEIPPNAPFQMSRTKNRHSFNIKYLRLDLTTARMGNNAPTHEIELEIGDISFVRNLQHRNDLIGVADKLWQNTISLFNPQPIQTFWREELASHTLSATQESIYNEKIGGPMPEIGDYIFEMAEKNQLNNGTSS